MTITLFIGVGVVLLLVSPIAFILAAILALFLGAPGAFIGAGFGIVYTVYSKCLED